MSEFRQLVSKCGWVKTDTSENILSTAEILSEPFIVVQTAVRSALEEVYKGNQESVAYMMDRYHPARNLVEADGVLDKLALIGTPEKLQERLTAVIGLLELNKTLNLTYNFGNSLIGGMSNYGNQIPIFYKDLHEVFDIFQRLYSNHPRTKAIAEWYQFRDSILEVSGELLRYYGAPFNEELHSGCFGGKNHTERLALPGVSTLEFMTVLCSANLDVARSDHWTAMVNAYHAEPGNGSWKKELERVRDLTIKGV